MGRKYSIFTGKKVAEQMFWKMPLTAPKVPSYQM
jgi:hypothetical protein